MGLARRAFCLRVRKEFLLISSNRIACASRPNRVAAEQLYGPKWSLPVLVKTSVLIAPLRVSSCSMYALKCNSKILTVRLYETKIKSCFHRHVAHSIKKSLHMVAMPKDKLPLIVTPAQLPETIGQHPPLPSLPTFSTTRTRSGVK